MKNKTLTIATTITLLYTNSSFSSNISSTVKANASIQSTCSIRADDFSFGQIDQFKTDFISSNIFIKCNNGVGYTINGDSRALSAVYLTNSNGEKIQYAVLTSPYNFWLNVFAPPIKGKGSNIAGIGTGKENSHQIYLRVYGKDFGNVPLAAPGAYADTFNISVTY